MKESYERMKLEIIAFAYDDVVTTSGGNGRDEYERGFAASLSPR